jgi:hypothetical protein
MIAGFTAVTDALWRLAATPTPTPTGVDADDVTPGVWGFAIIFLIAVVVVLLIVDMQRRVRRVNYKAEIDERLQAELAESQQNNPEGGPAAPRSSTRNTDSNGDAPGR